MISELVSKTSLAQSRAAGSLRDVKEAALKNLTHQINALFYLLTLSSFLTSSWERTSARCFRKKKKILEEANWSRDSFFKTDPLEFQFQICLIQLGLNSTVCRLHARFFFFLSFSSRSQIRTSETQAASRKFQIHNTHKCRVRSLDPNMSNSFFTLYLFYIEGR